MAKKKKGKNKGQFPQGNKSHKSNSTATTTVVAASSSSSAQSSPGLAAVVQPEHISLTAHAHVAAIHGKRIQLKRFRVVR